MGEEGESGVRFAVEHNLSRQHAGVRLWVFDSLVSNVYFTQIFAKTLLRIRLLLHIESEVS